MVDRDSTLVSVFPHSKTEKTGESQNETPVDVLRQCQVLNRKKSRQRQDSSENRSNLTPDRLFVQHKSTVKKKHLYNKI
jgi:hypothetical protein